MKTFKIRVNVSTRYVGSQVDDIIPVEVEDDATESEIEQAKENAALEWMHEQINWGWIDAN